MATELATLTGSMSDVTDDNFVKAKVRLYGNARVISDFDNNELRVLDMGWQDVAADGTFEFDNVVAAADSIVAGTLQYKLTIRYYARNNWQPSITLGPYELSSGTQDITDLSPVNEVDPQVVDPTSTDTDVLLAAQDYTDTTMASHEASLNPHPQYARFVNAAGVAQNVPIMVAKAGDPFPTVVNGALLFYGGI